MKFVRFQEDEGKNIYGWVFEGNIGRVEGDIFYRLQKIGSRYSF